MPFAPMQLVVQAVSELEGANPLSIVTVPALLRTALAAGADPAVGLPFGSTEESALLEEFFVLPRPPDVERPFRAVWSANDKWQKRKYPGGGLQRLRTDNAARSRVATQQKAKPRDIWRLTATAGADLAAIGKPVRIVDLALWLGRNQDVQDLDQLIAWFETTFEPDRVDLIGTAYVRDVPAAYRSIPFDAIPGGDDLAEQLGSLPVAPQVELGIDELAALLEADLVGGGFQLPGTTPLVRRVLTAWLRGDIVVLVGQPGTGKTMFAGLLGRAMQKVLSLDAPVLVAIRADFDEAEFLGYERLDGSPQYRDFTRDILLTESPLEARVVILEEFNLATIETYLSAVLVATQERERQIRLPAGAQAELPVDTFIIATCNSFRDEPETRTRVSAPMKRRATIITMPNVLADVHDAEGDNGVLNLAMTAISSEAKRVASRLAAQRGTQFDTLRSTALTSVTGLESLSNAVKERLADIASAILGTATGRNWFTAGLLRDVALEVAYADRGESAELMALGQAVADKLVHQLRGSHAEIQELRELCVEFPNAEEIGGLLARMMDGPSDELLPLL